MSPTGSRLRLAILLILGAASARPVASQGGGGGGPQPPATTSLAVSVRCETRDSAFTIATLRWSVPEQIEQTRVRFTIYNHGFEREWFAYIGFQSIVILPIAMSPRSPPRDASLPAYKVRFPSASVVVIPAAARVTPPTATMRLSALEPGVNYQWSLQRRVGDAWISEPAVKTVVPPCTPR